MEGGAYKRKVPNVGFINIAFLVFTALTKLLQLNPEDVTNNLLTIFKG